MYQASSQMLTQYIRETRSNGITSVLNRKRDKTIKSQHCANGSTQCTYMEHDEVMSLTISMEETLLTTVIEGQEEHDVTTCDIPNAFVQTHVEEKDKHN